MDGNFRDFISDTRHITGYFKGKWSGEKLLVDNNSGFFNREYYEQDF